MYLSKLTLSRYRSCKETVIELQKDLTVLVGENNGGKSNIIDGIRLLSLPLNGRREKYAEDDDLQYNSDLPYFQIQGEYSDLSNTLKGLLISAVPDPTKDEAIFGCRYEPKPSNGRSGQFLSWAGKFDTTEPESGSTDLIRHVYLPPLRDAQQALGSGSITRIMALFRHFLSEEEQRQLVEDVKRPEDQSSATLGRINTDIGDALKELTGGVRPQSAEVNFGSETIQDVARDLRFKLGDSGLNLGDIRKSGLGFSNLLYMASVVVELTKAKDADLTIFLVEEPEAHLHPQLQMLVLEFLLEKSKKSIEKELVSGQPEGRIQIIVTTHSPNLTAQVSPKHLVIVKSKIEDEVSCTSCVPVDELCLSDKVLNKLNRYLDVTRSALLFSNKAALVEGIAEAILLPVLAEKVLANDKDSLLRFKSTVIVPIDGVDFRPYVEILLKPYNGVRIADKVVIITDGDPSLEGNRKEDLDSFATELDASANLSVYTNRVTLEYDLFISGNKELLKAVYIGLHPRSEERWRLEVEGAQPEQQAVAFKNLLLGTETRKGDFAQELASLIDGGADINVPDYLKDAILKISEI